MATAKIYTVTCEKAYSASEVGTYLSLSPWGRNTDYYQGDNDEGTLYDLPAGFEVAESQCGKLEIYGPDGDHCELHRDRPAILYRGEWLPLTPSAESQPA